MPQKSNPARAEKPVELVVKSVEPYLLRPPEAARFTAHSETTLRNLRTQTNQRAEQGLPPVGPKWVTIGNSIFYLREDLVAFLKSKATDYGKLPFRGRREGER